MKLEVIMGGFGLARIRVIHGAFLRSEQEAAK